MYALTGESVNYFSGLSWKICRGSSCEATGKEIRVHSLRFLHILVRPHLPSLLNQHHMLQLLQHLRNPRLTLNLDVHRQQKSASIKRRKMTRTVVIPPIPKMGTMMTSTFPQGENHQASLSPKSPVYSQQQNVVRVRVILGQQLRCPPRLLLV